jgi:hypothetical protein
MHSNLQFDKKAALQLQQNIHFFTLFVKQLVFFSKRRALLGRSFFFLCILIKAGACSFEDFDTGVRAASLAGGVVALHLGAESLFYNPAGLMLPSTGLEALLSFGHPYEINELSLGQISAASIRRRMAIGVAVQHFGNAVYRENQFCLGAAYHTAYHFDVGMSLRYGNLSIQNYGQDGAVMLDAGVLSELSRFVSWGVAIKNINRAVIGRCREPLPQIFATGLSIHPRHDLQLLFELNKDVRFRLDMRCGLMYQPLKVVSFRAGVGNEPERFSLGFSLHLPHLRIDYSFSRHIDLGITHMAAAAFI